VRVSGRTVPRGTPLQLDDALALLYRQHLGTVKEHSNISASLQTL